MISASCERAIIKKYQEVFRPLPLVKATDTDRHDDDDAHKEEDGGYRTLHDLKLISSAAASIADVRNRLRLSEGIKRPPPPTHPQSQPLRQMKLVIAATPRTSQSQSIMNENAEENATMIMK